MTAIAFSAVAAVLAGFGFLILAIFCATLVRGFGWRRRERVSATVTSQMRDALVSYLMGSADLTNIKDMAASHRRLVDDAIFSFQGTVSGSALDRLCALALQLRLVQEWMDERLVSDPVRRRAAYARLAFVSGSEPGRRMVGDLFISAARDPDPEVRLAAARGAAQLEDEVSVTRAFDFALTESLLVRILMAESLRPRAIPLSAAAVPNALRSTDANRVLAALQILVAWERAVPFSDLERLLTHSDRRIRIGVLKLTHLVPLVAGNHAAIARALEDPDPDVGTAAALAAGRLRIVEALPSLARLLRVGSPEVARCAAAALAEMPPLGWQTLDELSASDSPVAAALARAALARAREKAGE